MKKITYTKVGDYNIPNLTMEREKIPDGKYAKMRLHYLKTQKKAEYTILVMNNELALHLSQIQEQATKMIKQIVEKMAKQDGVNEKLKMKDQMKWVGLMNNYKIIAEEQINYLLMKRIGFKNLYLYTKMRNVGGIAQTEAQKSSDLFMKCRYLDELTGGKGVVFATGTPVSNSMVELYTMQRYLQYNTLEKSGLLQFDSWASTFGKTVSALELNPARNRL